MPNTRTLHPRYVSLLRRKQWRDLKIALIYGLICSGLAAGGIYLMYLKQKS
jgi:hypothetical protein